MNSESYGPQIPSILNRDEDSDDSSDMIGPKLPTISCRGPEPRKTSIDPTRKVDFDLECYGPQIPQASGLIGPQIPSNITSKTINQDEDSDESGMIGPKLPSIMCRGPDPRRSSIGPQIPNNINTINREEISDDSSDSDMIGPVPPKAGEEITEMEAIARSFEQRSKFMRDKLEGKNQKEPKRESW